MGRRTGQPMAPRARAGRSAGRVMRTVTGIGRSVGAAVTGNRPLEGFEFGPLLSFGTVLAIVAALAVIYPRAFAWPFAVLAGWTALSLMVEAISMWRRRLVK